MGTTTRNSPKVSPKKSAAAAAATASITLQRLFELDPSNNGGITTYSGDKTIFRQSSSVDPENQEILSTIDYCSFTFTFTDPMESPSQQDLKREKLLELLSILKSCKRTPKDQILEPLFSMLSANLFRPLPPPPPLNSTAASAICALPEDEEFAAALLPSWPHLQIVYDILLRLIVNVEADALKNYLDHSFLRNLLSLFQSEDPRERESLKNIYHRIYSKFTSYRSLMRKAMNDAFFHYISEAEQRNSGIGELLEIWGSIINGFTVPLKEEHKLFLMRVLVPLHKPKGMQFYHRQLSYCVSQFVHKDHDLCGVAIRGILRFWPITNCQKEVLLITELEELVEIIPPEQYRKLALPLCTQITKSLSSWNSQVAERALYVWNNEQFVKMASLAIEEVLPVLVAGIEKNLKWHWSKNIQQLTANIKTMLAEMEPSLYSRSLQNLQLQESMAQQQEMRRKDRWERIEIAAARNQFLQQPHCTRVSHLKEEEQKTLLAVGAQC